MGKVVYFGLFFLGCFVFGSKRTPVEDEALPATSDEQPAAKSPCPSGALSYKRNCYVYFASYLSWESAEAACQSHKQGAHLASFFDPKEEKMVSAYIRARSSTNYVWIGLSATPHSHLHWEWSDGSHYISGSSLWDNRSPSTSTSSSSRCLTLYNVQYPTCMYEGS
ncbi:regenerating islet-derived protein 4-like [Sphaerodactylus townsendi]|uniref:regenerating islet-derived protein 4-like n=1 Tax=Sphaerodactylus townsendi TaxID=933632 RepID=UPI0020262376|nr:regenerating islet-derived protein 4-like [Sphaerodactylus townsendi]